ncbi:winged helix DNA-binding domain-containing protein [Agromyces intestinalis]|uniref:Winged helix DNA-binding domain-containing protein n=1 Tax=Agromyces intestinalis TaxID=2592652 RepID=A0A5C1YK49_9MICO|nr:winged helix DNA-binding domain-containing protein [Agromyces intestinalis]QEO15958.1 winged helix DNA-binding domain-containing protein [Agromyces intestinalis]
MTTDATSIAAGAQLRAARLAAHGLGSGSGGVGEGGFATPAEAVDRLVCLQAQDLAAAKWVLGARVPGSTEATIDAAVDEGSLLRSWPMRGTLHFVDPAMLRPILRVTSARLLQRSAKTMRDEGIDEAVAAAARDVAIRELQGGRSASRDELQAAWSAAGIGTEGQRGYHLIWRLANEGVLCGGPIDTRARQRFVLLDEWSPRRPGEPDDPDEILAIMFAGYARGHGPVSVRDFAWWGGLTLTQARAGLAAAGDTVTPYDDERYVAADAIPAQRRAVGRHVLAPFDEYFLGYGDRTAFCSADDAARVVPGKNGLFLPILVADGEVVGTWRRSRERRGETGVEVRFFRPGVELQAFRPAFERWAEFWDTGLGELTVAGD